MAYKWWNILDLNEFDATDAVSWSEQIMFDGLGIETPQVIKTVDGYTVIWRGAVLVPGMNGQNGVNAEGVVDGEKVGDSAYIDSDRNLWVGVYADMV